MKLWAQISCSQSLEGPTARCNVSDLLGPTIVSYATTIPWPDYSGKVIEDVLPIWIQHSDRCDVCESLVSFKDYNTCLLGWGKVKSNIWTLVNLVHLMRNLMFMHSDEPKRDNKNISTFSGILNKLQDLGMQAFDDKHMLGDIVSLATCNLCC